MTMRTLLAATAAVVALAAPAAFAACDAGETLIKFAHVTNADKHPKGIAAQLFADRVNAEMNGKVCVEVFPNSSLYDDDKVLEAMLLGDVQMAAPSLSKFETFTKKFRLFDLPFVFADIAAVDRYQMSPDGQALMDSMQRKGLQGLAFWHSGMKQLSAKTPLLMPEDAKGLKFRIQPSDVLQAQFEALGANPQKMAFSEVYGALQTGVVDGQENTWSNSYGQKYFEVQDGITETNHGVLDYMVVVGVDWWEGLDADVREQLNTIMTEVTIERNAAVTEVEEAARQAIIDAGGTVRTLTPEQRAAWAAAMRPVWDKFAGEIGQDVIDAALTYNARGAPVKARTMDPGRRRFSGEEACMSAKPSTALGRVVNEIEETLIAVILGLMTLITFANVVARYLFNSNILWALEATVFLFAWLVLLGASYVVKIGGHLGVDALVQLLAPPARRIVTLVAAAACVIFALLMLKGAWDYWAPFAGRQAWYEVNDILMPDWLRWIEPIMNEGEPYEKLPRFIPYAVLPVAMALFLFRTLEAAWKVWTGELALMVASHEAEEMVEEAAANAKREG